MTSTLFITNDFPPRPGGIQTFVYEMVRQFNPADVTVLASSWTQTAEFDAQQPFEIVRDSSKVLLPTPQVFAVAKKIIKSKNIENVVFGAAAPLGLFAKQIRSLGVNRIVAFTHGHEAGWAKTPVTKQALLKIGNDVDALTFLTQYTKEKISKGLSNQAVANMRQLRPGVDANLFNPGSKIVGKQLREQIGFENRPTIVSVSRLMARKGHDKLIEVLPELKNHIPNIALVIVGDGPYRAQLEKLISNLDLELDVHLTGKVLHEDLPAWYGSGDIFVMPCRTRKAGWDVEGLGIVYLEASATGLPVIAGNSGGAPEAVIEGKSGFVVDGNDNHALTQQIIELFKNQDLRESMGNFGRQWIESNWTWESSYLRLEKLLAGVDPDGLISSHIK